MWGHTCQSENNSVEPVLASHLYVGSGDGAQVARLAFFTCRATLSVPKRHRDILIE